MMAPWLLPVAGYLLGAIPCGYLIVRLSTGTDVRASGSGNIGATNVNRVAGGGAGAVTLLLDMGKGFLAVWLAARFTSESAAWMAASAVATVAGHIFPVWLRFRGGKGVATAVGAFLPLSWMAVGAAALIWLIVASISRYVSLGSVVAAAALPLCTYYLYAPGTGHAPPMSISVAAVLVAILVIFKHRSNMERLLAGTENRIRFGGR
jgi:glycerol-3-phosphate acyltransferase PlsY